MLLPVLLLKPPNTTTSLLFLTWAETWRRVWGDGKKFRGPNFPKIFFYENISIFNAENFWRPFLIIDLLLSPFASLPLSKIWYIPYIFFLTKNLYFTKNIPSSHIFLSTAYFPAHPVTLLLQILTDGCMGRHPPQIFLVTVSPSLPKSPPMNIGLTNFQGNHRRPRYPKYL